MNSHKGFANIVLVVVIVILIGAVGYFAFVKKSELVTQQTSTSTPSRNQVSSTPTDETANWKTYTNEKFGFEVNYPEKLTFEQNGDENDIVLTFEPQTDNAFVIQAHKRGNQDSLIVINTNEIIKLSDTEWNVSRIRERTVDFGYAVKGPPFYVLQTKSKNFLYASVFAGKNLTKEQNQILSTFKFTK